MAEGARAPSATPEEIARHVPSNVIPNIYASVAFENGVIVTLPASTIRYYEDGVIKRSRWHETGPKDLFVHVQERFPEVPYDLFGIIGGDLMSFSYLFGEIENQRVAEYCFIGDHWYAYGLADRVLRYWSPYARYFVADDVLQV